MNEITESSQKEQSEQPLKTKSKWRWLGYFLLIVILFIVVLIGLLTTSAGQRQALYLANKFIEPLSITEVSGNLQDGLILKNTIFDIDGVQVQVQEADLKVNVDCILNSKICIDNIALKEPKIIIDTERLPKNKQKANKKPFVLKLPIPISAKRLTIDDFFLKINETELSVQHLSSPNARWEGKNIILNPTEAQNITLLLPQITDSQAVNSDQKFANNKSTIHKAKEFDFNALKTRLAKPLLTLPKAIPIPLDLEIAQLNVENLDIKQKTRTQGLSPLITLHSASLSESKLKDLHIQVSRLASKTDKGNLIAQGNITLKDRYPLDWKINTQTPIFEALNIPASNTNIDLSGELLGKTTLNLQTKGIFTSTLKGNIQLNKPKSPFKLHLTSPKIEYPFIKEKKAEPFNAQNINLNLTGDLLNYDLNLTAKLLNNPLLLKGKLTETEKGWVDIQQTQLLYGKNNILMDGLIGKNSVLMNGLIGKNSDFKAKIDAPNLKGLVPYLNANIKGNVDLKGNITQPNLDLDLTAKDVSYQELKLKTLTAKGKISSNDQINADVIANLSQFSYNDIKVKNAKLSVKGKEKDHSLSLISNGEPIAGNLQISGKFNRLLQQWTGKIENTEIKSPIGKLNNNQAIQVNYQHKKQLAEITSHCWKNTNFNLCFPKQFVAGKTGEIPFEIKGLNLDIVKPYLNKKTQLNGIVNLVGNAQWFTNKSPEIEIKASAKTVNVNHKIDYRSIPVTLAPLTLAVKLENNNLKVNSFAQLKNNGSLTSELTINDIRQKRLLGGYLNIKDIDIKLLKSLLSKSEKVLGKLNTNLTFGGMATAPLLNGKLELTKLKAQAYTMPFDINDGYLTMDFNGTSSNLNGKLTSPNGNLILSGDADWKQLDNWRTRIHASTKDKRFRLNIPNIAKLDVITEIEVSATPKKLILDGDINIPWAKVEIEALPLNAISVSSDEVIMDGSIQKKRNVFKRLPKKNDAITIEANVNIRLAEDNVKLDAYGLKTDLNGLIKVKQGKRGLGLYGQVFLDKGTYNSFGQNLIIRKGSIIFSGIPSQPSLNIEAIRNPEAIEDSNVTAGIKITGVADTPKVTVFSEPAMAKANALSYILTGRGLKNSGETGSQNSIAAAAIGLGLSQSSKLIGNIGNTFGISDLNVTTAGIGNNTKVVVSGSLTPKFKVKYGTGIFAALSELTLRYRLAPQLYLQWVSSINQTVDLMYKFEFD